MSKSNVKTLKENLITRRTKLPAVLSESARASAINALDELGNLDPNVEHYLERKQQEDYINGMQWATFLLLGEFIEEL